jgi:hypothetical protein
MQLAHFLDKPKHKHTQVMHRHVTTDLLLQLYTHSFVEGMTINGYQRVCVGIVAIARCSSSAVELLI